MGGTAPTDADLLDDADTEVAAAAAERSVHQLRPQACHLPCQEAYQDMLQWHIAVKGMKGRNCV